MKRALLAIAALLLVLVGIGAAGNPVEADAAPTITATEVPAACLTMTAAEANSPDIPKLGTDIRCRDYLYQVHCQFVELGPSSDWRAWCNRNLALTEGPRPEVPRCDGTLGAQHTTVGERCRDYLAATVCRSGIPGDLADFCKNVAPNAGPDPQFGERYCNPDLAQELSFEGNQCWKELENETCPKRWDEGTTGFPETDSFCEELAEGAVPPTVPPVCDRALAGQDSVNGHACRDLLVRDECKVADQPADLQKFCKAAVAAAKKEGKPIDEGGGSDRGESSPSNHGSPDVLLQLGHEPACGDRDQLSRELQRACALSGSSMHSYPFASYGIDNNVAVDFLDSDFWSGEAPFMSLFQWLIVGAWQILVWLVKIALLIVQWAFAVDPLSRAGGRVGATVKSLFDLIGPEWRLTAVAVLGVWGFWNGLVRRKFMETFSGLIVSLLLMVVAMWIVYDPEGTVGKVGQLANDASVVMLSATSSGELNKPEQGLANGQHRLFDQLVVGPWCALEFGGNKYCYEKTSDPKITRADLWLTAPANSTARELLYRATSEGSDSIEDDEDETSGWDEFWDSTGDGICILSLGIVETCESLEDVATPLSVQEENEHPEKAQLFREVRDKAKSLVEENPSAVALQGSEGAFTRAGLLAIIAIGMIGAVAFFFAIGVRLLVAGVILLLLILFAPVMFIVAAFGEEGRRRFITWVKMLFGAAIAKLVYSVLFGLVLAVVFILIDLAGEEEDWLGCWLLVSAFFWVAVLQMNRVLSLFSPDPAEQHGGGGIGGYGLMYMGQRMVSQTLQGTWRGATYLPRKAAPRAVRAVRRERAARGEGTEAAIRGQADRQLEMAGTAASLREKRETGNRANEILDRNRSKDTRQRLRRIEANVERTPLGPRKDRLERQKRKAEGALRGHEAEESWARWQLQSHRQQGEGGPSEGELRARRFQRERDISRWRDDADSWSSESNRRWAGITDAEWKDASRAQKRGDQAPMHELRGRTEAALKRDQRLFDHSNKGGAALARDAQGGTARVPGRARRQVRVPRVGRAPQSTPPRPRKRAPEANLMRGTSSTNRSDNDGKGGSDA